MGANFSTPENINSQIIEAVTTVINENISTCKANNQAIQTISIDGINLTNCDLEISNFKQTVDSSIDLSCAISVDNKTKFENDISQKLTALTESAIKGVNFGLNVNAPKQISNLKTKVLNDIKNRNVYECVLNNAQSQLIDIKNITAVNCPRGIRITDLQQVIIASNVANCVGELVNDNDIKTIVKQDLTSTVKAVLEGLDPLASALIVGVIGIIILVAAYLYPGYTSLSLSLSLLCVVIVIVISLVLQQQQSPDTSPTPGN